MKNLPIIILAMCLLHLPILAQEPPPEYTKLIKKAFTLYEAKEYKKSAFTYSAAVKSNGGKGYRDDRYNAACSWALAGYPDSAFYNLNRIATMASYANYRHITTDKDLTSLHTDKRWSALLVIVQQNKDKEEEKYNKPLVRQLDSIYTSDQSDREKMEELTKTVGLKSNFKEIKALRESIIRNDSINLLKVKAILDQYGWLGPDVIGQEGNTTLFLVIQHSDLATQEKYLPMMKEAVRKGKAEGSQLALLVDRVEMFNNRPQIYGSQISSDNGKYIIYKIIDEANVNKRRAEVGLEPLEEYVKQWNIDYKLPKK